MGLGWDYIEDLKKYDSQEAIEKALQKEEANSDQKINAKALWQFANEMKPGDVVFAKKGKGRIIGSGEVASDYSFNDDRDELKHVRSVNWKNKGDWPNPGLN
jgi:5-methylcytosine-specific restriction protein B